MLSTRPEKSVGTDEIWDLATEGLKGALERKGWDYSVRCRDLEVHIYTSGLRCSMHIPGGDLSLQLSVVEMSFV